MEKEWKLPTPEEIQRLRESKGFTANGFEKETGISRVKLLRLEKGEGVAYPEAKRIIEILKSL